MSESWALRQPLLISSAAALGLMPPFLFGASGVMIRGDLGFGRAGIGVGVTAFFAASALSYGVGGRIADRWGPGRSMRTSASVTAIALAGIAGLAQSLAHMVVLMAVCGLANGIMQPATSLALARGIAVRQGVAFGMRQSAAPVSTLLAGAALPLVGLTVGWRWIFAGAAVMAVGVVLNVPADGGVVGVPRGGARAGRAGLVLLASAVALASATPTALAAFFVEAAVDDGVDAGTAGWLLVLGSGVAIVTRLLVGWHADRKATDHPRTATVLLGAGALGYAAMAHGGWAIVWPVGIVLAYGVGWGWTGLLLLMVVRAHPEGAGAASGVIFTGLAVGAAVGPVVIGLIVEHGSFFLAWWTAAAAVVVAAGLIAILSRRVLATGQVMLPELRAWSDG